MKKTKSKAVTIEAVAENPNRKVSITFQAMNFLRNAVGQIAMKMGYTRMNGEKVQPELTPALVLLLEFGVAHEDAFRQWVANGKKDVAGKLETKDHTDKEK